MKKAEAIEFIKKCAKDNDAPYGFFVVAISREDLVVHCESEVVEEFDSFSKAKRERILSNIANELEDEYQEYTFGVDMDNMEIDCQTFVED